MNKDDLRRHKGIVKNFIDHQSEFYMSFENMEGYSRALHLYFKLQDEERKLILKEIEEEDNDL